MAWLCSHAINRVYQRSVMPPAGAPRRFCIGASSSLPGAPQSKGGAKGRVGTGMRLAHRWMRPGTRMVLPCIYIYGWFHVPWPMLHVAACVTTMCQSRRVPTLKKTPPSLQHDACWQGMHRAAAMRLCRGPEHVCPARPLPQGETPEEIAGLAKAMLEKALPVSPLQNGTHARTCERGAVAWLWVS